MPDANVTELLGRMRLGDRDAEGRVLESIYQELHRLARSSLRRERPDHTLQPSALLHEAYLRLANSEQPQWLSRGHFYAVAARLMRQILIDHARAHAAEKRGSGVRHQSLEEESRLQLEQPARANTMENWLHIHEAIQRLAKLSERQAQIVELRFFAGLEVEEVAQAMEISERTVKREWAVAKAWLQSELQG